MVSACSEQIDITSAWSLYWRSGKQASFTEDEEQLEALCAEWRLFFAGLRKNAAILDLGTGNGAVLRVAAEFCQDPICFSLHGVDAAEVHPPENLAAQATFLTGVKIEALPFEDAYFDAVASQFALEYGDRAQCCAEATRVLRRGGHLKLLSHAAGGALHSTVRGRVERLSRVLAEGALMEVLVTAATEETAAARRAEQALQGEWSRLQSALERAPPADAAVFFANGVANMWRNRHRYNLDDLLASLQAARTRSRAILLRLEALQSAACTKEDIDQICCDLRALGMAEVSSSAFLDKAGRQLCWVVEAERV